MTVGSTTRPDEAVAASKTTIDASVRLERTAASLDPSGDQVGRPSGPASASASRTDRPPASTIDSAPSVSSRAILLDEAIGPYESAGPTDGSDALGCGAAVTDWLAVGRAATEVSGLRGGSWLPHAATTPISVSAGRRVRNRSFVPIDQRYAAPVPMDRVPGAAIPSPDIAEPTPGEAWAGS
jgi:hypothetical protein